ncbi:MAG: hypothetical protein MJ202_09155 [Lentisphaeria bacterium]|nr:hypothetical protein [Lentisphaeria bacterium]
MTAISAVRIKAVAGCHGSATAFFVMEIKAPSGVETQNTQNTKKAFGGSAKQAK